VLLGNPQSESFGERAQACAMISRITAVVERKIRGLAAAYHLGFLGLGGIREVGDLNEAGAFRFFCGQQPRIAPFPIKIIGFWRLPEKPVVFMRVNGMILPCAGIPSLLVGNILLFLLQLRQLFSFTFDYPDV
jgi:hypothetical protein